MMFTNPIVISFSIVFNRAVKITFRGHTHCVQGHLPLS